MPKSIWKDADSSPIDFNRLLFHELPKSLKNEWRQMNTENRPLVPPPAPRKRIGEPARPISSVVAEKRASIRQLKEKARGSR